ncbi:collagen alpha-2(I) chain-like isoform X2 [Pieris brassicae]|uniref:collagen alpha-2(I) chain-like isoform X2 n=1 Tax=Pieris brassicae TaxID=7116 RepID=UPI001E660238|nr:collagen alpha-2(I) chain-like isoform X2 [Pieris brassicae]
MGPYITVICCMLAVTSVTQAEQWRWRSDERSGESQEAQPVRIDNKVLEDSAADRALYSDEMAGFYKRPFADSALIVDRAAAAESQGTLDDLMYCRCERASVRSLQCVTGSRGKGCSSHEYLCCSFSATQDPNRADRPLAVGPQGPTGVVGPFDNINTDSGESASAQRGFYSPGGSSGFIDSGFSRPVLVGPGGPTGIVGPRGQDVLIGPGGPTGIIGSRRQGVLVGPGGPTGIIGPAGFNRGYGASRPGILVGPGGPTGIIGPRRQGVLVGPGGPTGNIGPAGFNRGYGTSRPGLLVGPGGPTGRVGPGRQVLVGPGGATGQIGPRGSFGK